MDGLNSSASARKRKSTENAEQSIELDDSPAPTRKRASRACDGCKLKRWKCDGKTGTDDTCIACRNAGVPCTYVQPARKRGPAVGFRERQREERESMLLERKSRQSSPVQGIAKDTTVKSGADSGVVYRAGSTAGSRDEEMGSSGEVDAPGEAVARATTARYRPAVSRSPHAPHTRGPRTAVPLLGLPRAMVDSLLGVYFTHVHNVWPLIYKSSFSPHTASPLLLLSMLAISACIAAPAPMYGLDAAKLYRMAESALHQRRDNGIDIIQAVVLLSLRQTGCGDKGSAFIYAGRACAMVLNSGLNLARKDAIADSPEEQTRSRVFWNCYVLDKTLAEETGRSFLLPYRRCSTPFPSTTEVDELESWPPASFSSAPLPRSVRRIVPRRGYVISCFVWTCRLAKVVEEVLDLEFVEATGENEWDRQFRESGEARRGLLSEAQEAERISEQLRLWREMLPRNLQIDDTLSPMPHHAISLAWHTTSTIMLHSRYVTNIPRALPQPTSPATREAGEIVANSHDICSAAAASTVDMMRMLDKYGLMEQLSSDIIHILSLVTLFLAFDSTSPTTDIATRAKRDFQQSCTWLRALTASWPAASAHKLFFEAVIEGGMKLADTEAGNDDRASPLNNTGTMLSPGLSGGLQAVRRHLSVSTASKPPPVIAMTNHEQRERQRQGMLEGVNPIFDQVDWSGLGSGSNGNSSGAGGMMLLPHIYWNQLSTAGATTQNPLLGLDIDHDFGAAGNYPAHTAGSGYDDFSFGFSSFPPGSDTVIQQQQQQQRVDHAGDSSSFIPLSPTTRTTGTSGTGISWLNNPSTAAARVAQNPFPEARQQEGSEMSGMEQWLSPTMPMSGLNFTEGSRTATNRPSDPFDMSATQTTHTRLDGTSGMPSGQGSAAAMLKQDQSQITAALMRFMADMRGT